MLFLNESAKYIGVGYTESQVAKELDALSESMGIPAGSFDDFFPATEAGGVEILSEMKTGWMALERDMILHEAHCAIQGIPLNEGVIGDFFKKIKDFFVKIWNTIKGWFKRMWDKLFSRFANAQKWLRENEKKIPAGAKPKVDTYPYYVNDKLASATGELQKKIIEVNSSATKKAIDDASEKLDKQKDDELSSSKIREALRGSKETQEIEFPVDKAIGIIKGYNKLVAEAKNLENLNAVCSKEGIVAAEAGIKQAEAGYRMEATSKNGKTTDTFTEKGGENEVARLKALISFIRSRQSVIQNISTAYMSAVNEQLNHAFYACRKAIADKNKKSDEK